MQLGEAPGPTATALTLQTYIAKDGRRYIVALTPHDTIAGVRSVTFRTWEGEWVGSVRVGAHTDLRYLTSGDLQQLLCRAVAVRANT